MFSCLGLATNSSEVGLIVLSSQKFSVRVSDSPRVPEQLVVGKVGN